MSRGFAWFAIAAALSAAGTAGAQILFEPPGPEVYTRAADRALARLQSKPCTEADVDRGCRRHGTYLFRDSPCTRRLDAETAGSLPTDQCFKMEKPRRYRGVYIDAFEGQQFIPDGATLPQPPAKVGPEFDLRAYLEQRRLASIWLDVTRTDIRHDWSHGYPKYRIEFIGRKTMYPGYYGHMGSSANEIVVDRVISLTPLK